MKNLFQVKLSLLMLITGLALACNKPNTETVTAPTNPAEVNQAKNSTDFVKATGLPAELTRAQTGDALVRINVQDGYHINANPPTFPYLKATELDFSKLPGVSVSFVVYPNSLTKRFAFAEKPLAVYEGTVEIKVRLKADKSASPGTENLSGKLRIQACDEQVCYAPGTLDVSIPLSIK